MQLPNTHVLPEPHAGVQEETPLPPETPPDDEPPTSVHVPRKQYWVAEQKPTPHRPPNVRVGHAGYGSVSMR